MTAPDPDRDDDDPHANQGGGSSIDSGGIGKSASGTEDDDSELALPEVALITGFPSFTARRMLSKVLAADPTAKVIALSGAEEASAVRESLQALPPDEASRVEVLVGDVCALDLGLAGPEYCRISDEVTAIYHLAGVFYPGIDRETAFRINVGGARHIVELGGECKRLRRICHFSTVTVSGKLSGTMREDDLDLGQSFHNPYEESKFQAEKLMRAAQQRLPITIVRPGIIVGDSRTGEIDTFDGPYYLIVMIATNATHVRLPIPGRGTAPLHLVPIDYVMDAAYALSIDERAAGKTFHLIDPSPLSARRVCELVAERAHTQPPRGYIPSTLARMMLKAPFLDRLTRGPQSLLSAMDTEVVYSCQNTLELLADTGIRCPSFESYVDVLVEHVREAVAARRQAARPEDDDADPFD